MIARSTEFDQFWNDSEEVSLLDNIKSVFSHDLPRQAIKPTGFFVANAGGDKTEEMIDYEKNKAFMLEVLNDPKIELEKFYTGLGLIKISRNRTLKEPEGEYYRKVQYVMSRIDEVQPRLKIVSKTLFDKLEEREIRARSAVTGRYW